LRERITRKLATGELEHGDRLPSLRELARELASNPRAVHAAYQELMDEGLVEIRERSGVFAIRTSAPRDSVHAVPRRWMLDTLLGAIERDIPPLSLAEGILAMMSRRPRAAVLECNDDQLNSMCAELGTYFGMDALAVSLDSIDQPNVLRKLREMDILVSAGHADSVARVAAEVDKPYLITNVRPSLVNRLIRLLDRGPVYFLVTDPRFGVKMRGLIAPMARSENFHALVVDRDDLRVIPPGAPTYVMHSARARLNDKGHLGREISAERIFSHETSREILSRILHISPRS
jgi:regulatory GntR family protein